MKHDSVSSRVVLEVDLGALERNFGKIRARVAPLGAIVVLKADAYGLGMPAVARRLVAAGAAGIATAS
ncbi:MAG: alanine racemase, partial [Kiritimatiellae bacterium]|nr:alanine racemase [Kiritimatiellia bacterium]